MSASRSEAPVALVTGGAVRVGRGIVDALLDAGYRVWVHFHRSATPAANLATRPGVLGPLRADLANEDERAALCDEVSAPTGPAGGALELLVNSAASFERGRFETRTDDDLLRVLQLNLVAPLALVRRLAPVLRQAPNGRASVINIVDRGAFHPWTEHVDHCIAKAALHHATRALAAELAPLRLNAIAPGTIETAVPAGAESAGVGTPADVGQAVVYLAGARHVSGHTLLVDGGHTAALAGPHP